MVTDGKMVLALQLAEEGGYTVTSPFEPGLVTEAETIPEAFDMARDALAMLRIARRKLRYESVPSKPIRIGRPKRMAS